MAKLYFYYSAMNAGKSTTLLQSSHNYHERGMETLLFVPSIDTRFRQGVIHSRIGLSANATMFDSTTNLYQHTQKVLQNTPKLACVLVDEAQFLSKANVKQLTDIADKLNIPVLAYGLRSDFRGDVFEGSLYLLAWAEEIVEIKTICHCGRKATMNLRVDKQGQAVTEGAQVEIADNDRYLAACRKCFKLALQQAQSAANTEAALHEL